MSRSEFGEIALEHYRRRDYTGMFEVLYAQVGGDPARIPWADLAPHAALMRWLKKQNAIAPGLRALVVGSGLGDDALALAELGYDTLGFDISPTAVEWANKRLDHERLRFETADLFDPPASWHHGFDLVVEIYTLQALPLAIRPAAFDHVAAFVKPGGKLVMVCRGRDEAEPAERLPFPLTRSELGRLAEAGLQEVEFEDFLDDESPPVRRFLVAYQRPAVGQ